jgi:hypothetical protein
MLKGKFITLRPVLDTDLDQLYSFHIDIDNRGDFFPRGLLSQPAFQKQFQETGFWSKDEGMLVIVSPDDTLLGHIEFFKTVNYLDELNFPTRSTLPNSVARVWLLKPSACWSATCLRPNRSTGSGWSFILTMLLLGG